MKARRCIWAGGLGSAVAAICCFTPALAVLLAAVGLSAWLAWLDWLLLPGLLLGLAVLAYGLYLTRRQGGLR